MDDNNYFNENNGTTSSNEKNYDENIIFQKNKLERDMLLGDNQPYREELKILKKHIEVKRIKKSDNRE